MKHVYEGPRLRKGDVLLIPFGGPVSRFKVIKSVKRKSFLKVRVIEDNFVSFTEETWRKGQIVNIGKEIYESYWIFEKESK